MLVLSASILGLVLAERFAPRRPAETRAHGMSVTNPATVFQRNRNKNARASSSHHHGAVADQSRGLCGDVCAGCRRTFTRRKDDRRGEGGRRHFGHPHGCRPHRDAGAATFRRIAGCLHGGGWRRAGVDGVLHAERATGHSGCKINAIAHAADSLCRQPGTIADDHALRCPNTIEVASSAAMVAIAAATGDGLAGDDYHQHFGQKQDSGGFLRDTLTRFMGLIVLSMGVQFALTGYHAFME